MLSKIKEEFENIIYGRRFLKYVRKIYANLNEVAGGAVLDNYIRLQLALGWMVFVQDTDNFDNITDINLMHRWFENEGMWIVADLLTGQGGGS